MADEFDVLVIWRSDRLCRGLSAAAPVFKAWAATREQFRVESITDYFDLRMVSILSWATKKASEDIKAHTMENRLARARRGEAVFGVLPYWIRRDPVTRKPVLVVENGAAVLRAAEMYLAGETIVAMAGGCAAGPRVLSGGARALTTFPYC